MNRVNLGLAMRIVIVLSLAVVPAMQLFTPITWTILLFIGAMLVAADTVMEFRLQNPTKVQKLLGVTIVILAFCLWGTSVVRLWRDRNLLLRSAAIGGYEHILRWSLTHGADPNTTESGESPLMLAVTHNRPMVVRLLIESGADVNRPSRYGRLPVIQAAGGGHIEVLQELCSGGANLILTSKDGSTALNEAADFGQTAAVAFILEHGAPVDQRGEAGRTALIDGAGHPNVVRALLAAHANVNLQGNDGITALMVAAGRDIPESVELLLQAGADPTVKDHEGHTALDLAKQYGASKTIPILQP